MNTYTLGFKLRYNQVNRIFLVILLEQNLLKRIRYNFIIKKSNQFAICTLLNNNMIEESSKSGTYIQFSFEKSLRKYQKPSCKKIKSNLLINNQHSNSCQHCLGKLYRRDTIASTDRILKIQSNRKNELMQSRQKARQFSQTKRKKFQSNSANKSRQSSIKKQTQNKSCEKIKASINLPDPLSEFNIEDELNLRHLKKEEILSMSLNKQVPRLDMQVRENDVKANQCYKQLSIERIFKGNNLKDCEMESQNNSSGSIIKFQMVELVSEDNQKIIQEQDQSFSQLSLGLCSQLIHNKEDEINNLNEEKMIEHHMEQEQIYQVPQNPVLSFAYFSSCTSVQSFTSSLMLDNSQNQVKSEQFDLNPFYNLKLQSKEELKKQYHSQQRQRIFYKIKRITQTDKLCSQCENVSENIKKELVMEMNHEQFQQSQKTNELAITQNQNLNELQLTTNYQNIKLQFEANTQIHSESSNHSQLHEENIFKRLTPCQVQRNKPKDFNKQKNRKINFQIDEDYERLGRVRISGLGKQNDSICLSVRRLNKQTQNLKKCLGSIQSLDENKVINYLISQRPYLQKNKEQLQKLVQLIIGKNDDRAE